MTMPLLVGVLVCAASHAAPTAQRAGDGDHAAAPARAAASEWPQFRGPGAGGVSDARGVPTAFDTPTWRRPVPGLAHASPVVADGRVFVLTAIPTGIEPQLRVGLYGDGGSAEDLVETEFRLLALDVATGEVLWDTLVVKGTPPFGRHTKATQANSTPAVADGRVVALCGSHGLFCLDAATGEARWHAELGALDCGPWDVEDLHWGFASSPVIADGHVLVQADVKTAPYLASFALATGAVEWRVARDDVNGWSTPTVTTAPDGARIVLVNGCKHIGAYALADGAERWRMAGGGGIPVPTPVVAGDLAYFTSNHRPLEAAHPQKPVYAVRLGARGDLGVPQPRALQADGPGAPSADAAPDPVAWVVARRGNYMQTPLVHAGQLWLGYDNGVVTCLDAATGVERYRERLSEGTDGFTASPVAAEGRLYFTSEQGEVFVLAAGPKFEVLARGALGDVCMASPAVIEGALIFRLQGSVVRYD
ncbi:MAG: PQQ-binding-like beta-propeller repeat protein [Planctomycetota bacterium]